MTKIWRDVQEQGDKIGSGLWNSLVQYVVNHASQHELGGEQPVNHDALSGYDSLRHRKIIEMPMLEIIIIDTG